MQEFAVTMYIIFKKNLKPSELPAFWKNIYQHTQKVQRNSNNYFQVVLYRFLLLGAHEIPTFPKYYNVQEIGTLMGEFVLGLYQFWARWGQTIYYRRQERPLQKEDRPPTLTRFCGFQNCCAGERESYKEKQLLLSSWNWKHLLLEGKIAGLVQEVLHLYLFITFLKFQLIRRRFFR